MCADGTTSSPFSFNLLNDEKWMAFIKQDLTVHSGPQGYKTFFVLNSAEHEIFSADKYENFHIY